MVEVGRFRFVYGELCQTVRDILPPCDFPSQFRYLTVISHV
jgi:hypothetical protein